MGFYTIFFETEKSVSGIGMIYVDTLEMMQKKYGKGGVSNLNEIMYNIGLGQSTILVLGNQPKF